MAEAAMAAMAAGMDGDGGGGGNVPCGLERSGVDGGELRMQHSDELRADSALTPR